MTPSPRSITQLLIEWRNGDESALNELMPLVHTELHRMARNYMRREQSGHTLQTTALVNELYLRLSITKECAGRIGPTFTPWPPSPCGEFWLIMRVRTGPRNVMPNW